MQANLELTQLFSNAHDILYSRRGRAWKVMIEGDYIKYIVSQGRPSPEKARPLTSYRTTFE